MDYNKLNFNIYLRNVICNNMVVAGDTYTS